MAFNFPGREKVVSFLNQHHALVILGMLIFGFGVWVNTIINSSGVAHTTSNVSATALDIQQELIKPQQAVKKEQLKKGLIKTSVKSLKKGENLAILLQNNGVDHNEVVKIIDRFQKEKNLRYLRPGQKVELKWKKFSDHKDLVHVSLDERAKSLLVKKEDGGWSDAQRIDKELETKLVYKSNVIQSSIFMSAKKVGMPQRLVADMVQELGYAFDLQRDIRKGQKLAILYEVHTDKKGNVVKEGPVVYASIGGGGLGNIELYRYDDGEEGPKYYTESGKTLRKGLMRTPIDGAIISSHYGPRKHPVLGYNRVHKGTDFAAPGGTPVFAAGDGVIEKIGPWGGYGNYVRIRHNQHYSTAYAHLQKFAKNLRRGTRVKQGEVIAYVGTTGRSTGPHLHYEVIKSGKRVNSQKVKLPEGHELNKKHASSFKKYIEKIDNKLANIITKSAKQIAKTNAGSSS